MRQSMKTLAYPSRLSNQRIASLAGGHTCLRDLPCLRGYTGPRGGPAIFSCPTAIPLRGLQLFPPTLIVAIAL